MEASRELGFAASGGTPEDVHARLRDAILSGDIAPGQVTSQVALAKAFGVSTTPLREAIRMLQLEGLVEAERNRRVRIASLSVADMDELYCQRILLECALLRLGLPTLTDDDLAELEGALAQMTFYSEQRNYAGWEVPHRAFHAGLAGRAAGRMRSALNQIWDHCERYRRLYTTNTPRAWGVGIQEHRAILDAVHARDADLAAARLATHLAHTVRGVIAAVEPAFDPRASRLAVAIASTPPDPLDGGLG